MSDTEELEHLASLPSYDAIAYMVGRYQKEKSRGALRVTTNWQDMWHEEHAQAFTISRLTRQDLLAALHKGLVDSVRGDLSRTDWMKNAEALLAKAGWWGRNLPVTDRRTGEELTTTFNPSRLSLIYDTNTRHAYAAGQWQRIQAAKHTHPYLRYVTRADGRVREQHRAWHNVTLPVDDPFWDTHFPPNGWRCRCRVIAMSEADVQQGYVETRPLAGWGENAPTQRQPLITERPPESVRQWYNPRKKQASSVPVGIAPGFAYNIGKARAKLAELERLIEEKEGHLQPSILAAARKTLRLKPEGAKELSGQDTWKTLGLPSARDMKPRSVAPARLPKADTWEEATDVLRDTLGVAPGQMAKFRLPTGEEAAIWEELLPHITEKRMDARERFAAFVKPTLQDPDEIWETRYDDGTKRKRFLRLFAGDKYSIMLIVQQEADGSILWNLMNREQKGMNDWRAGSLVYSAPR